MANCKRCGACCRWIHFPLFVINDEKWIEGRGGVIKGKDVYLPSVCKWIGDDNLCKIEGEKPQRCKNWPENVGRQAWLVNMGCKYFEETT